MDSLSTKVKHKLTELQVDFNNITISIDIKVKVKDDNNNIQEIYLYSDDYKHYCIYDLDEDCIIQIMSYCDSKSIARYFLLSKSIYNSQSEYVWNSIFNNVYPKASSILKKLDYTYEIKDRGIIIDDIFNKYHPNYLSRTEYNHLTNKGYLYSNIYNKKDFYRNRLFRWIKSIYINNKVYSGLYDLDYQVYDYYEQFTRYATENRPDQLLIIINKIINIQKLPINALTFKLLKYIIGYVDFIYKSKEVIKDIINFNCYQYFIFYIQHSPTLDLLSSGAYKLNKYTPDIFNNKNDSILDNIVSSIVKTNKLTDIFKLDFCKYIIDNLDSKPLFKYFDKEIINDIYLNLDMATYSQHDKDYIIWDYSKYGDNKKILTRLLCYNFNYIYYNMIDTESDIAKAYIGKYDVELKDIKLLYINEWLRNLNYTISSIELEIKESLYTNETKYGSDKYIKYMLYKTLNKNSKYINIKKLLTQHVDIRKVKECITSIMDDETDMKINYRLLNIFLNYKFKDSDLKILYEDGSIFKSGWNRWNKKLVSYIFEHILSIDTAKNIINQCNKNNIKLFKQLYNKKKWLNITKYIHKEISLLQGLS